MINLKAKARTAILFFLQSADSWVKVDPTIFNLTEQDVADVNLRFTPPLAGPSKILIQAAIVDPRGLLLTGQVLDPVDLHIIPKAKYARWLAEKFLQTSSGAGTMAGVQKALALASSLIILEGFQVLIRALSFTSDARIP